MLAAGGCYASHTIEPLPERFESLEGPLCVLVPRVAVSHEEALPMAIAFVDGAFTLGSSGVRHFPENRIGAMLGRFDWRGRVVSGLEFVDPDRAGNSHVGGFAWTGAEYVVTWGDRVGVHTGAWNVARVDAGLRTIAVERALDGTPCWGSLVQADGTLVQPQCPDFPSAEVEAFVFRAGDEGVVEEGAFGLGSTDPSWLRTVWDGHALAVVTSEAGGPTVFRRIALDGTTLDAPLELAGELGGGPSIAWNGSSFGVAFFEKLGAVPTGSTDGTVRFAQVSTDGELLSESVLAEGDHAAWHPPVIAATGAGFAVAWLDRSRSRDAPARLQIAPIDASGTPTGDPLVLAEVSDVAESPSVSWPVLLPTPLGLAVVYHESFYRESRFEHTTWYTLLGPCS